MQKVSMIGKINGRLTVIEEAGRNRWGEAIWLCACTCGNKTTVAGKKLRDGHTRSCGCLARDTRGELSFKHGQAKKGQNTKEYNLWTAAKRRAEDQNVPFSIEVTDIVIPTVCPILGCMLEPGHLKAGDASPSLDKIIPELGYVPGNIAVISFRANQLKSNGTAAEHRAIADWMDSLENNN